MSYQGVLMNQKDDAKFLNQHKKYKKKNSLLEKIIIMNSFKQNIHASYNWKYRDLWPSQLLLQ